MENPGDGRSITLLQFLRQRRLPLHQHSPQARQEQASSLLRLSRVQKTRKDCGRSYIVMSRF